MKIFIINEEEFENTIHTNTTNSIAYKTFPEAITTALDIVSNKVGGIIEVNIFNLENEYFSFCHYEKKEENYTKGTYYTVEKITLKE